MAKSKKGMMMEMEMKRAKNFLLIYDRTRLLKGTAKRTPGCFSCDGFLLRTRGGLWLFVLFFEVASSKETTCNTYAHDSRYCLKEIW